MLISNVAILFIILFLLLSFSCQKKTCFEALSCAFSLPFIETYLLKYSINCIVTHLLYICVDMLRLKQNVKTRKLDGFSLEICEVAPPRSVVVSSDSPIRNIEIVKQYFERDTNGGRLKKKGVDETEDGCCLLEFEDYRGIKYRCRFYSLMLILHVCFL